MTPCPRAGDAGQDGGAPEKRVTSCTQKKYGISLLLMCHMEQGI